MANLGGVLNNAFSTVQVPMFSGVVENSVLPVNSGAPKIKLLAEAVTTCGEQFKTLPNELKQEQLKVCMLARLEGIYGNEN